MALPALWVSMRRIGVLQSEKNHSRRKRSTINHWGLKLQQQTPCLRKVSGSAHQASFERRKQKARVRDCRPIKCFLF